MRSMNERTALSLLIARGPMTRVGLGEATGLSAPTTAKLVKRLSDVGLMCPAGHTSGSRGPTAAIYRACTEAELGVAVHMRLGYAIAQVVDASDQQYPVAQVPLPDMEQGAADDLARAIEAACEAAGKDISEITAICVGVPGSVSADGDVLRFAENIPGWPRHAVRTKLEQQLGVNVMIENDANLAAVAESDARGGEEDFVLLWSGEGLAIAAMTNLRVYRGVGGGAGEIGYLPVPRTAASLDQRAFDMQDLTGPAAVIDIVAAHRPGVTTYDAALEALDDPELRRTLLAELAPRIAEALMPVIAILDPPRIVLAGPTGAACGVDGANLVQAYLRRTTRWRTPVIATIVPAEPVLRGAALTLSEQLAEHLLSRVG